MIWRRRQKPIKILGYLLLGAALTLTGVRWADADNFTGNWNGTWTSIYSTSGTLGASVTQTGANLSGNLDVGNTDCGNFSNLLLLGVASGNTANFYSAAICILDQSYNELEFTQGNLVTNQMSGYYTIYSDGAYFDSGTFSLSRTTNLIEANAGAGGTITPSGSIWVTAGGNQTFTITPETGYQIADVQVDGVSVGAVSQYPFTGVNANYTISASFAVVAPVAGFTAQPLTGKVPLTVSFTDQSTGSISSRTWSFGDGGASSSQNPSHTYTKPGKFTVSLTVSGPGGDDTSVKAEYIEVKALADGGTVILLLDED